MCGIAGYFGQGDSKLLEAMLDSIRHRGPDDEGVFFDDNFGMGIRRLAIIDTDHGNQPIHNEEKTLWIIYNGEIYNFLDIKNELVNLGHTFYTDTDTEVLLHAYEEWNEECLKLLNGMFAFAIWDTKKKRLFLARDRLGIKPLYYYSSPQKFLFASEIKALLVDSETPRVPNEPAICNFLLSGFQYTEDTFFSGIKELPPGHYMIVDQKGLKLSRYWSVTDTSVNKNITLKDSSSKFVELLSDAIEVRIPSDLSVGSYLSGGIDSTAIVCLTDNILRTKKVGKSQKLISAVYHEAVSNERPFIEAVARGIGTEINYVYPSTVKQWNDIKTFVYHLDEPVAVLNYYTYWCLAKITTGLAKVTFSGQGPDEFLAGHNDFYILHIRELFKRRQIARMFREILSGFSKFSLPTILGYLRHRVKNVRIRGISAEPLLNQRFVESNKAQTQKCDTLRSALLFDMTKQRLPMHLRVGDRVTSAFSLESRFPFLDHRIIEFSFTLPPNHLVSNGSTKHVFRNGVKNLIPESIRRRRKMGTPIPLECWLKEFRHEILEVFNSRKFIERGYFNHHAIIDVFNRYCDGQMKRFERLFYGDVIWRVLNVELWMETFFDTVESNLPNSTMQT
jgi:asparagine synthase (glutamine-hydrolysing)